MSDATLKCFEELTGNQIDRTNGVIHRVCMLEEGEAKGHGIWIDRKTLETALECAKRYASGIKVKLRHNNEGEFQNILLESFGQLKDYFIEGKKLLADLWVLDSVTADLRNKAFEMAEKMADQFGLSIDFAGVAERINGKPFLRCSKLNSVDLSGKPAATSGLFSMKETKYENGKDGKHAKDCECAECSGTEKKLESLTALVTTLAASVTALSEKFSAGTRPNETTAIPATAVGALEYKDATGKTVKLEAADIFARLETADKFVAESKKSVEASQRTQIIDRLCADGRTVMNPDTGVAYKLEELQTLDLGLLKFAEKNCPQVPLSSRLSYKSTGGGPPKPRYNVREVVGEDGTVKQVPLKGEELMAAGFEAAGYGSLAEAIALQNSGKLSN